jgi:hypothetical protein
MDVAKPPEVLAEGTAVFEQDGRLTVPGQGITLAVKQGFSAHAEVEQERYSWLDVNEDPFAPRRHTGQSSVNEQSAELLWRHVQTPGLDDVDLGHASAAEFLVHLPYKVRHFR